MLNLCGQAQKSKLWLNFPKLTSMPSTRRSNSPRMTSMPNSRMSSSVHNTVFASPWKVSTRSICIILGSIHITLWKVSVLFWYCIHKRRYSFCISSQSYIRISLVLYLVSLSVSLINEPFRLLIHFSCICYWISYLYYPWKIASISLFDTMSISLSAIDLLLFHRLSIPH